MLFVISCLAIMFVSNGANVFDLLFKVMCLGMFHVCVCSGQVLEKPSSSNGAKIPLLSNFWAAFQDEEVGPFRIENVAKGHFIDELRRNVNVVLERKSGFAVSGGYCAGRPCPDVFYVPRTLDIPRMTVSNLFVFVASKLNCKLNNRDGFLDMEQQFLPCAEIPIPSEYPVSISRCVRSEYPGKRKVNETKELSSDDAQNIIALMRNSLQVHVTAVNSEYFVIFRDGLVVGLVTDDEEQWVVGFDFGCENRSILDADDGYPHRLMLIMHEEEGDADASVRLKRKKFYRKIKKYWGNDHSMMRQKVRDSM